MSELMSAEHAHLETVNLFQQHCRVTLDAAITIEHSILLKALSGGYFPLSKSIPSLKEASYSSRVAQHTAQHTGDVVSPCIREPSVGNNPSE